MFFGEHRHALDAKGRLTLPAKYRSQLAEGLMVTKGEDHCLRVYPLRAWEKKQEEVLALDAASERNRDLMRALFSGADEGELDSQGRILLRENLRRYAGIERDCAVLGVGEYLEIWSATEWDERSRVVDETIGNRDEPARS